MSTTCEPQTISLTQGLIDDMIHRYKVHDAQAKKGDPELGYGAVSKSIIVNEFLDLRNLMVSENVSTDVLDEQFAELSNCAAHTTTQKVLIALDYIKRKTFED